MTKLDLKKADRAYYTGKQGRWDRLTLPALPFLAIDGKGDPSGPAWADAVSALYGVAYAVKFSEKGAGRDFGVPPLEGLWWADDPAAFTAGARDDWRWRALIRMPESVTEGTVTAAKEKKGVVAPVSLIRLTEGDCLQTLHLGSYADEAPVLADLHNRVMPDAGLTFAGPHHEIYLSDPRRTAPENLKTILRQPIRPL
ncbi:GyrI-like domain-containing protein [Sinisalibacter aestuarii]|uniref:GyrI-like small molecule binding domain-containing protein n=1 Tax=Sinisalibacter aestuarii TaxID=2949426 RepID=A0ABQ5LPM8_9RHOB|nr:GyrI-like domain-containing protein [Sinisalibacter aestuarii]GKY86957.1 hypothetical protein STA1M1_08260 [Sinisalibacter aestuarii]